MAFFLCGIMGYLFHVWGGVGVGPFFVISICTELLCFRRRMNNCFWNIWVALKRPGRSKTRPDWMATEEAAAVEAVL